MARSSTATMADPPFPLDDIALNRREFVVAGWFSYLPATLFELYTAIMLLGACGQLATETSIRRFLLAPELPWLPRQLPDFDAPHERGLGEDPDEISWNRARWAAMRVEAERRDLSLVTTNDMLGFMCDVGLLERDGSGGWLTVLPVPLLEDAIEISERRRLALANLRMHVQFAEEKRAVREWLDDRLVETRQPVETSIAELMDQLPLDSGDIRWALALLDDGHVISIDPAPESLPPAASFRVEVDWDRFDDDLRFKREMGTWLASTDIASAGESSPRRPTGLRTRPCDDSGMRRRPPRR